MPVSNEFEPRLTVLVSGGQKLKPILTPDVSEEPIKICGKITVSF